MSESKRLGVMDFVEQAGKVITEEPVADVMMQADQTDYLIVDVRDIRERQRDGFIPQSFHCPRGMLEFWIDPESPYFKTEFEGKRRIVFHCAADWRAMLCTHVAQLMGNENVAYMKGGLTQWKEEGGAVAFPKPRS